MKWLFSIVILFYSLANSQGNFAGFLQDGEWVDSKRSMSSQGLSYKRHLKFSNGQIVLKVDYELGSSKFVIVTYVGKPSYEMREDSKSVVNIVLKVEKISAIFADRSETLISNSGVRGCNYKPGVEINLIKDGCKLFGAFKNASELFFTLQKQASGDLMMGAKLGYLVTSRDRLPNEILIQPLNKVK